MRDFLIMYSQEKGGIFSGMFKKSPKPADEAHAEEVEITEMFLAHVIGLDLKRNSEYQTDH